MDIRKWAGAVGRSPDARDAKRGTNIRIALCVNAHLSDDKAVAKMGHPAWVELCTSGSALGRVKKADELVLIFSGTADFPR